MYNNIGEIVSSIIGWTYFLAWSISFYPQAILNWKRKSVQGLSIDFLWYNFYGFMCYSVFNLTFFFSEEIQKEYRDKNGNKDNLVRANDDFTGGVLSNFQLILDAYLTNNWSGIKGDFVKL
nr:15376_t:CDS:2 [Entrophospora candida]